MNVSSLKSSSTSHMLPRLSTSLHSHQQQQPFSQTLEDDERDFVSPCTTANSQDSRKVGDMGVEAVSDEDRQPVTASFRDTLTNLPQYRHGDGADREGPCGQKDGAMDRKMDEDQQQFFRDMEGGADKKSLVTGNRDTDMTDNVDEGREGRKEDGVGCMTCQEHFPTMEDYVSHQCAPTSTCPAPSFSSSAAPTADRPSTDFEMEEKPCPLDAPADTDNANATDTLKHEPAGLSSEFGVFSDIKSFTGQIVYNPDGSAYVIEDDGESDDSNLSLIDVPKVEGAFVDRTGAGSSSSAPPIPQIASAVFVARPFSSWCRAFNNVSDNGPCRPDGMPMMYNFRVYSVRGPQGDCVSKRMKMDSTAQSPLLPAKPILMCFMCKLSFGLPSSFTSHALVEHLLELTEEERTVLARPKASAIIQGVGKEKLPLMSFLELLPSNSSSSSMSAASASKSDTFNCTSAPSVTSPSANMKYMHSNTPVTKDLSLSPNSGVHGGTADRTYSTAVSSDHCPTRVNENSVLRECADKRNNSWIAASEEKCMERSEPLHGMHKAELTDSSREGRQIMAFPFSSSPAFGGDKNDFFLEKDPPSFPTSRSHDIPQDHVSPSTTPMSLFHGSQLPLSVLAGATCDEHPLGRVQGTECSKCDMILGSPQSLGGHMTMMHSRNSSKTLKCPRCNWHYKYQETLEIHMKEKHPDNDAQCLYCVTNQAHPRLARGETYSCGYKPYHCSVCNYSTTTKGNLTIHMQSDKHINNMQEFTNGGSDMTLPPSAPTSVPQQQAQPKAAGVSPDDALKKMKPKPPYRCEWCNYETAVARNMRIHNTSEKHTHNLLLVQQNMKRDMHNLHMGPLMMDPLFALNSGSLTPGMFPYDQSMMMGGSPSFFELPFGMGRENGSIGEDLSADAADTSMLYHCTICTLYSSDTVEGLHVHLNQDRTKQNESDNIAFENGTYTCLMCQYKSSLKANFQLHCKTDKHLQRLQLTNHIREGGHYSSWRLSNLSCTSHQVRCNACNFYTNSIHKLQIHASQLAHETNVHLFRQLQMAVARLQSQTQSVSVKAKFYYRCVLCSSNTRTKQAMLRHTMTAQHVHNQQTEVKHRTMDPRDFFTAVLLQDGDSVDFEEADGDRTSHKAQAAADGSVDTLPAPGDSKLDHLTGPPSTSSPSVVSSVNSFNNNNNGGLELTTTSAKSSAASLAADKPQVDVLRDSPSSSDHFQGQQHGRRPLTTTTTTSTTPTAAAGKSEKTTAAVKVQHHQHQQVQCPLCQDECQGLASLERHLAAAHKVTVEGMQKLLNMVEIPTVVTTTSTTSRQPHQQQDIEVGGRPTAVSATGDNDLPGSPPNNATPPVTSQSVCFNDKMEMDVDRLEQKHQQLLARNCVTDNGLVDKGDNDERYHCRICSRSFTAIDDLYAHQNELGHLELKQTPRGPGYLCWKKGCNQYFKTAQALQEHFKHIHFKKNDKENSANSYRCYQCSSLPPFKDETSLHSHRLYHLAKSVVQCGVCSKCFHSVKAHKCHLQKEHAELSQNQLEKLLNAIDTDMASLTQSPGCEQFLAEYLGCEFPNRMSGGNTANLAPSERAVGVSMNKTCHNKKRGIDALAADIARKAEEQSRGLEKSMNALAADFARKVEDQNRALETLQHPNAEEEADQLERQFSSQQSLEEFIQSQAMPMTISDDCGRKFHCQRCRISFSKQSYLIVHKKTSQHQHGSVLSSYTMERYLDPSRPYKCEVCRESFTQKNILLSHYNSVNHLHTVKASKVSKPGMLPGSISKKSAEQTFTNGTTNSSSVSDTVGDRSNKKLFKCNLCNVAFSDLDSHQRTTVHQAQLVKLSELMMTGQINYNQPLIEHPDFTIDAMSVQQMQLYTELMQQQQMAAVSNQSLMFQAMQGMNSIPMFPGMPSIFGNPPTSFSNSTTAALASYASAASMERELANQMHQQSQPQEKFDKHVEGNGDEKRKDSHDSRLAKSERSPTDVDDAEDRSEKMTLPTEAEEDSIDDGSSDPMNDPTVLSQAGLKSEMSTNTSELCMSNLLKTSDQPSNPVLAASLPVTMARPRGFMGRFKPQIHRNLLENIGFEFVMQFNEASQNRRKEREKERDEKEKSKEMEKESEDANDENGNDDEEKDLTGEHSQVVKEENEDCNEQSCMDLPEINKCCCLRCGSEFSSVFVLKAHEEAVHKEVIPIYVVEEFGERFKEYFEEKQPKAEPEPLLPAPQLSTAVSTQQPAASPITNTVTTSTCTTPSTEKVVVKASKDEMPPPPPPPPQLPSPYDMAQMMPMLGMMPMPMNLMGLQNPLVPMLPGAGLDMGSSFPLNLGLMDPSLMSAQQQIQQAASAAQNQKRVRTRITDEQLKILRAHFDINNSPTEAQISKMSEQSGLPQKVIKHWFRNTLFKERQRNKDSPYNFSVPPSTTIDLEEYEKTGKIPATTVKEEPCEMEEVTTTPSVKHEEPVEMEPQPELQPPAAFSLDLLPRSDTEVKREHESHSNTSTPSNVSSIPSTPTCSAPPTPTPVPSATVASILDAHAMALSREAGSTPNSMTKRANRTRFTDAQVKMLQEYFEQNAYPKDDELDHLSKMLNLSPRVIVVWFQNARQKARKIYENQPSMENKEVNSPFQRTAGNNHQCRKCGAVFQRYYELIKHQKRPCFSENNNNKLLPSMTDDDSLSSVTSLDESGLSDTLNLSINSRKETVSPSSVSKAVRCDKCNISFSRIDLWQEHQKMHDLNVGLFPPFSSSSAFGMLQSLAQQEDNKCLVSTAPMTSPMTSPSTPTFTFSSTPSHLDSLTPIKRKLEVSDDDRMDDQPRDKRLRTTILPEQLDYLYQKYQLDCNPSRKQLESISQEVGLKKRVVQVWFQNTRARERKGQFRAHTQLIHKRCPFCRALFRAKSAMESHLATKHPEEMAKGDISVDSIPDAVLEPPHSSHSLPSTSNSYHQASASASAADFSKLLSPSSMQPYMSFLPPSNLALGFPPPLASEPIQLSMQHLYENAYKKYISELSGVAPPSPLPSSRPAESLTSTPMQLSKPAEKPPPVPPPPSLPTSDDNDAPLDLSVSVKSEVAAVEERSFNHNSSSSSSSGGDRNFSHNNLNISSNNKTRVPTPSMSLMEKINRDFDHSQNSSFNDSNSETYSDFNDSHYQRDIGNSPSSPKQQNSSSNPGSMQKRYRTQMTSLQVKVMKLLFVDYKTPTMTECELLGKEIGLPKRVVQVWFQNARAKEKKSKAAMSQNTNVEVEIPKVPEECQLCNFKYSHKFTVQDHIFTKHHIDNAKSYIQNQSEAEREISDPGMVSGLLRQQSLEMESRLWDKTCTATSQQQLAQIQQGLNAAALGLPSAVPGLGNAFPVSSLPLPTEGASKPSQSEKPKAKDQQKDSLKKTNTSASHPPTSSSSSKETVQHHHSQHQQQAQSAQQAAELAHMMALGGFLPGLDPGYLNYMYSAGLPSFFPNMTAMPLLQPGLLPGAENMLAYDAMSFGTPLHLLNLPEQAIKSVTQKVEDASCTLAHYTQDCKSMSDLKTAINSFDLSCFTNSVLDVGYICKKCHMVYPARDACLTHQRISCYVSGGHGGKTMVKLEQLLFECQVCVEKFSTVSEVKAHCKEDSHKRKASHPGSTNTLPSSSAPAVSSHSSPKAVTLTSGHTSNSGTLPYTPPSSHASPKPVPLSSEHTSSTLPSSSYISDRVSSSSVTSVAPTTFSPAKSPALALPLDEPKNEESLNQKMD